MANRGTVVRAGSREMAFLLTAEDTGGTLEWVADTVEYGAGPIYHIHHDADEVFHVLEGEIRLKLDGAFYDLRAADVAWLPRGVPHSYTNVHREQAARIIGLYAPAGLQAFLRVWDENFADSPPGEAALAELAACYRQEPAGPPLAVELGLEQPSVA